MRVERTEPIPQCEICGSQLTDKDGDCICKAREASYQKLAEELAKKKEAQK